jgi:mRNA-degrading endonuclease toxin of MazEF toxin-antitoxin module
VLTCDAAIDVLAVIVCAPITRTMRGIRSEVEVGPKDGFPEWSVISCDNVIAVPTEVLDREPVGQLVSKLASGWIRRFATPSTSSTDVHPAAGGGSTRFET